MPADRKHVNTSCGVTVKCLLDADKSPIFRSQSPYTYIYVQESQRFWDSVRIYTYESTKWLKFALVGSEMLHWGTVRVRRSRFWIQLAALWNLDNFVYPNVPMSFERYIIGWWSFYLVSMPGKVKYPSQGKTCNMSCSSLALDKDKLWNEPCLPMPSNGRRNIYYYQFLIMEEETFIITSSL